MNIGGVLMLAFIGSLAQGAAAQAAFAIVVLAAVLAHHVDVVGLMGAAAAVAGQNLGAHNPDRAERGGARRGALRLWRVRRSSARSSCSSRASCSACSA
jgi:Na+-driven multidrug efflux pump